MRKIINKIKCFLGFHSWVNIDPNPVPEIKDGESIQVVNLHECSICKYRTYLGMGTYC